MASKVYTAQEMRQAADEREAWGDKDDVNKMLRQAADALEREERVKKYEYGVRIDESKIDRDYIFESEEFARTVAGDSLQVVRREVGEWEEVRDGDDA